MQALSFPPPGDTPAAKSPPPPLPKSLPKGRPQQAGRTGRGPPPRPGQPPSPRKAPPPPVPAKRPVGRPAVLPADSPGRGVVVAEQAGSSSPQQDPPRSYEQVVVEEKVKVAAPGGRQPSASERSPPPETESAGAVSQRPRSYQQVVVEENGDDSSAVVEAKHPPSVGARRSPVPAHRPRSYENVALGGKSLNSPQQASSAPSPLRSYEHVLVEDGSQPDSEGGDARDAPAKQEDVDHHESEEAGTVVLTDSPANSSPSPSSDVGDNVQNQTANSGTTSQDPAQVADDRTDHGSKNPLTASKLHCDGDAKVISDKNSAPACNTKEKELPSDERNPVVKLRSKLGQTSHRAEDRFASSDLLQKALKENSPKGRPSRPCPPPPPPVRPKPKKRISLLRQSVVTEEDAKEEETLSAAVAESQHSNDSAPESSEASDSPVVQEALYQEIDELEQPGPKWTGSSGGCKTGRSQGHSPGWEKGANKSQEQSCVSSRGERTKLAQGNAGGGDDAQSVCDNLGPTENHRDPPQKTGARALTATAKDSDRSSPEAEVAAKQTTTTEGGGSGDEKGACGASSHPDKHNPITLQDVGETSFMLKEIEQLLNARLASGEAAAADTESKAAEATSDADSTGQTESTPVRPPRPRRMDKLRKLTIGSVDSSSTESLTSIGQPGKKAPPKPRRKHVPARQVKRSSSDITGMKSYVDQLKDDNEGEEEAEEKPSLPPRQQSLRLNTEPKPPPLPPRNKSMEQAPEGQAGASASKSPEGPAKEERKSGDRRSSAPSPDVAGVAPTKVVRSVTSGAGPRRKHIPRPTRKAPPPPSYPPPAHVLSMSAPPPSSNPPSGASPSTPSSSFAEKVPGYQKITNGSVSTASDDINTVVPKTAVVGNLDSPCAADVSTDHDYHEIPDHLLEDLAQNQTGQQEEPAEGTPPPDLPPRGYNPPAPSMPAAVKSPDPPKKEEVEACEETEADSNKTPRGKSSESFSAEEDSASQSSQVSSRPESFCSEVMGSLLHVVGERHRPPSMLSSSSHSETGSGEVEVPTFDHSSASESENEDDEDRVVRIIDIYITRLSFVLIYFYSSFSFGFQSRF